MGRIIAGLFAGLLLLSACGGNPAEAVPTPENTATSTPAAPTATPVRTPFPTNTPNTLDQLNAELAYLGTMQRLAERNQAAFAEMWSLLDRADFEDPAWRLDLDVVADELIGIAEEIQAVESPSARFDAAHGSYSGAAGKITESMTLLKTAVRTNGLDDLRLAVTYMEDAVELINRAVAAMP